VIVGVDGRSLTAADRRGVSTYTEGMLAALRRARPEVEWRVRRPRRRAVGVLAPRADVVWLPAPAPVIVRAPFVLTLHDLSWLERPADFTRYERAWLRAARAGALARRARRVVAASEATAAAARAHWDVDAVVVPAGPGDPGPPAEPAPGRYFLFVGALEPRKGLPVLLAAHARARTAGLGAELRLAGDGRLRESLRGPGVKVLGRVSREEKAALYAGALAVVLPSWLEGYGYPPLEGFAHGVPAIVTATGRPSPGTVVVPPGDAAGLAAAMLALAADPPRRAQLAAAGAAALPTWDECAALLWEQIAS
jgi:glycosyltransferase involved in cell wall biosynthesis